MKSSSPKVNVLGGLVSENVALFITMLSGAPSLKVCRIQTCQAVSI